MTTLTARAAPPTSAFLRGLAVQGRVIGALIMRELHTRYGRENVGYLWLFVEPMLLASVIGILHSTGPTVYGTDIRPLPFAVIGYTTFIMFRGVVTRSEGALESNGCLMFHRAVTIFDIMLARAILESVAAVATLIIMFSLMIMIGQADFPVRPLYELGALFFVFLISLAHALVISAISLDNRTVGRIVHPYAYFQIPTSGAFFQMEWIPHPFRDYLSWLPLPNAFEMLRYGQFRSASPKYFSIGLLLAWSMALIWIGLVLTNAARKKMNVR